ncbi:MAG TPA: hypothetical protein VES62_07025, partial [Thermoleophilaceae bacterium]|nr:hypothetical protein [Thermoleophilaceae bacterium]
GFRLNALGLRPVALGIAAVGLAISLALLGTAGETRYAVSAAVAVLWAAGWFSLVTEAWVRRAAERYADRLFESLGQPQRTRMTGDLDGELSSRGWSAMGCDQSQR